MALDFPNICANPFICGYLGALIVEDYSFITALQDAMYDDNMSSLVTLPYMLIRIIRFILLPLIGGVFVYFLANSPGAPIWQLIVGATSVGFLEKISGHNLQPKSDDEDEEDY